MLKKQELCKDYMQGLEPCWKLCDAPFLAMRERESRHFNDESTSKDGPASIVVPIDKLSILVTIVFSRVVFHEKLSKKALLGLILITVGTVTMTMI